MDDPVSLLAWDLPEEKDLRTSPISYGWELFVFLGQNL